MVVDEYVQARPSAALRPYVGFLSGYRQCGVAPGMHLGLPSPFLTLIFTIDEPLVVAAHPDPRQPAGRYDALIGGLHLTPATIVHDGWQSGVQVAVDPLGCRALFGRPAAELAGLDVDASAVLGASAVDETRDRLRAAPDWSSRFAVVDAVLVRQLARGIRAVAPEVTYAYRRLIGGGVAIRAVADEVGWSGRHLTDRFRAEVGLRPKEAARVARFDRARRALRPTARMADIAAGHGFADQSHLVREFQAFAGCAPSRWLADEFGFVQALAESPVQDHRYD
ncbi:helix-turn-helix domain-containing protein [Micromonosporaceae bacterium Da 78-11]